MGLEATPGSDEPDRDLRLAIEVEMRNRGARPEQLGEEILLYLPETIDMRFRLGRAGSAVERLRSDGDWETVETASYAAMWDWCHRFRAARAYKVLIWCGVWFLLGVVLALGVLLDLTGWLGALSFYVPLAAGLILWFAKIPFQDFYPGAFVAGALFGLSVAVTEARWTWWWLVSGAGIVGISIWGWLHCGGPELITYLRSMFTSDPRRAAALRFYEGDGGFRGSAS